LNIKTNIHKIDDNGNDSDSESDEDEPRKRKKAAIQLEIGDDGRPLLPDTVMDTSGYQISPTVSSNIFSLWFLLTVGNQIGLSGAFLHNSWSP
jgi:hypothetical protein